MKIGNVDVYENEILGGQYMNFYFQVYFFGLVDQFIEVKKKYIMVNKFLGDVVKVYLVIDCLIYEMWFFLFK